MTQKTNVWNPMPRFILREKILKRMLKQWDCANKKILEIGYGAGHMLFTLSDMGFDVYGYDASPQATERILNDTRYQAYADQGKIKILTSLNNFTENQFDFVFAFEVLEHIEDDKAAVVQWSSLLKDDGKLIISVPAHMKSWGANDDWGGHLRRYEKKDFTHLAPSMQIKTFYSIYFPFSLLLDPVLNKSSKKQIDRRPNLSSQEYTDISGIERDNTKLFYVIIAKLFYFLWIFQLPFLKSDLGSGYIMVLERIKINNESSK